MSLYPSDWVTRTVVVVVVVVVVVAPAKYRIYVKSVKGINEQHNKKCEILTELYFHYIYFYYYSFYLNIFEYMFAPRAH